MRPKLARMTEEQKKTIFLATIAGTEGLRVMATFIRNNRRRNECGCKKYI